MKRIVIFKYFILSFIFLSQNSYSEQIPDEKETIENQEVAENIFLENKNYEPNISSKSKDEFLNAYDEIKFHLLIYGEIFPSVGLAFRFHGNRYGIEIAASGFPPFFIKAHGAFLTYFGTIPRKWYAAMGLSLANTIIGPNGTKFAGIPIFGGYQGNLLFFDLGIDLLFSKKKFSPLPAIRFGFCF